MDWISIHEKLPPPGQDVLVKYHGASLKAFVQLHPNYTWDFYVYKEDRHVNRVYHWHPLLPERPFLLWRRLCNPLLRIFNLELTAIVRDNGEVIGVGVRKSI